MLPLSPPLRRLLPPPATTISRPTYTRRPRTLKPNAHHPPPATVRLSTGQPRTRRGRGHRQPSGAADSDGGGASGGSGGKPQRRPPEVDAAAGYRAPAAGAAACRKGGNRAWDQRQRRNSRSWTGAAPTAKAPTAGCVAASCGGEGQGRGQRQRRGRRPGAGAAARGSSSVCRRGSAGLQHLRALSAPHLTGPSE